jgi:hypothetical protein
MPTSRPRLNSNEKDDVAQDRSVIEHHPIEEIDRRRQAIAQTSGALTGDFEPGYLDQVRDDWPS